MLIKTYRWKLQLHKFQVHGKCAVKNLFHRFINSWLTSRCISALADAVIWSTFASLETEAFFVPFVPADVHVQFLNFFSNKFLDSLNAAISSMSFATSLKYLLVSLAAAFFTFPMTSSNFFVSFFNFRYSPSWEALNALLINYCCCS